MTTFDPVRVLATLHRHDVLFVLVGGLAAVAHGSTLATADIDIAPERSAENLDRLAAALRELDAKIRIDDAEGVDFPVDAAFLAAQPHLLNLVTTAGDVDLTVTPAAFPNGYDDLLPGAVAVDLGGDSSTLVAALRDIIASKEAAGRPKDQMALPYLYALADELESE